jgi:SAM-dependent methyltransferase
MSAAPTFTYPGAELAIFDKAQNWKRYWRARIAPYIHGHVLEVGAGIGANTRLLADLEFSSWTALEPDATLAAKIELPSERHLKLVGTLADIRGRYDAILYIDVLEHIEDDRGELARAADHLNPGGALIVLAPAHPFLYTPFDSAIGHFRRYTCGSLKAAAPAGLVQAHLGYLDCAGMLASAANRLLLRSDMPTESQVLTWDRFLVPVSRILDPALAGRIGKSILGIWRA